MSRTLRWLWLLGLFVAIAAVHAKPLRWAVRSDPQSLDPHAVLDATGPTGNIYSLIYDSLTQRDREQRVVPRLATTWELVNDTTWRFKLRNDVKFHDGSPLTADDVVFSIERAQQPSSPWAWVARRWGKPVRLDSTTVELRMLTPHPLLLESLEFVPIMSRAWCLAHGVERVPDHKAGEVSYSSRNAMGSGPFVLKSWQPGGRLVLTRNPHWWGKFEGNVSELTVIAIANDATRTAALLAGDIDFTHDTPLQDIARLEQDPRLHLQSIVANGLVFFGLDQYREELLYSSVRGRNPFKDVRVREALWRAIDVETLRTKVMRGLAAPTGCMAIAEFACLAREAERRPAFDLKRARKLMADAGYSDGFELTLDCPNDALLNDVKLCTAVSAMLARIRVAVKLNVMPKSVFLPKINNHDTSFYLSGWGGSVTDAGGLLNGLVRSFDPVTQRGGDNHARFIDLELDRLLDAAAVEMDREKRSRMIREALQRVHDRFYYMPIHRSMMVWASRKNVRLVPLPSNIVRVDWIEID